MVACTSSTSAFKLLHTSPVFFTPRLSIVKVQHLALSIIVHHLDGYFGILTVSLFNMKNKVAIPFEGGVFVLIELKTFTILISE